MLVDGNDIKSGRSELLLVEIRRRHCRVPTILFWVGTRHVQSPLSCLSPTGIDIKELLLVEIRRRQCRVPKILFWVGTRHVQSPLSCLSATGIDIKELLLVEIRRLHVPCPYNIILGRDTALPSPLSFRCNRNWYQGIIISRNSETARAVSLQYYFG